MTIRIDRTNLQRGSGSNIAIYAPDLANDDITLSVFDVVNEKIIKPEFEINNAKALKKVSFITPKIDGFLLADVKGSKVIKKIGYPPFSFCISFEKGYSLKFEVFNAEGDHINYGFLKEVTDGFYYTKLPSEVSFLKIFNKVFTLKEEFEKVDYEANMSDVVLGEMELLDVELNDVLSELEIDEIELSDANLNDIELIAEIREL